MSEYFPKRTNTSHYQSDSRMREADLLTSAITKLRGKCENCGSDSGLTCAHGFSRKYLWTRWDVDTPNCFCLCYKCHGKYSGPTIKPWWDWMIARIGWSTFSALRARATAENFVWNNEMLLRLYVVYKERSTERWVPQTAGLLKLSQTTPGLLPR